MFRLLHRRVEGLGLGMRAYSGCCKERVVVLGLCGFHFKISKSNNLKKKIERKEEDEEGCGF